MRRPIALIILVMLMLVLSILPAFAAVDAVALEKELMCYCDCNMVLSTCECEDAAIMRADIRDMVSSGMDQDAILAAFVEKYGETILTSPQASGFNLSAWIVPIVALIAGAGMLFTFLNRTSRNAVVLNLSEENKLHKDSDYDELLEEEIKKHL